MAERERDRLHGRVSEDVACFQRRSAGHGNEKVVSSASTSSVTIFIHHQSPFRFAAAACYVVTLWKRPLLTTKSAYTGDPQLTFTFIRHRRPVFHSRYTAWIFRAPLSTRECDDRISRPRSHAHATIDRSIADRCVRQRHFRRRSHCAGLCLKYIFFCFCEGSNRDCAGSRVLIVKLGLVLMVVTAKLVSCEILGVGH